MYLWILGASIKATTPEMPVPSSMAMLSEPKRPCSKKKFGEAIHYANKGVTFHTTMVTISEPKASKPDG